jgi:monooxygenase
MADDRDRSGHFDVLIIGAGLSGIGAAYQLQSELPGKTYALLESRESMGGTWDFFNYPGFRSDTDMQTLGYRFRPWTEGKAVADGPSILRYIKETAREGGVDRHIRYNHRAERAEWSTDDAQWTVTASRGDSGETATFTCSFLYVCSGYYKYDQGYSPEFEGTARFEGPIIHPHRWPDDLDYTGKRVVIVGSGATAVTLVPAMAPDAAHVTMLQRSPSYVIRIPLHDRIANGLRRLAGDRFSYLLTRWKNIFIAIAIYQLSRRRPRFMRRWLRSGVERSLPEGYDVDTHFNPDYEPWDQRLCMVPDGDLFKSISDGSASVVTDRIETFTEKGLKLESGRELEADIVVTATGFDLLAFGGIEFKVDGREINLPETYAYKGLMLSGLPNYAYTLGYTNAPFTLKADLVAQYVCRLLTFMDERDLDICVPIKDDPTVGEARLLDFEAGYVKRSEHLLPKAGSREPWKLGMSYVHDLVTLRHRPISDGALRFSRKPERAVPREHAQSA